MLPTVFGALFGMGKAFLCLVNSCFWMALGLILPSMHSASNNFGVTDTGNCITAEHANFKISEPEFIEKVAYRDVVLKRDGIITKGPRFDTKASSVFHTIVMVRHFHHWQLPLRFKRLPKSKRVVSWRMLLRYIAHQNHRNDVQGLYGPTHRRLG